MKVFISWSGTRSKKTAALLHKWLPQIINEIEPWMSDNDLKAGGDWSQEIRDALDDAKFGIICVTPGNMKRSWLLFEAGALSRQVQDSPSRVAPFVVGFESKSDLPMPLARFQATEPTQEDMRKLLLSMNELCTKRRTMEQIDDALDHYWESFLTPYEAIRDSAPAQPSVRRSDRQVLDDILEAVRSLQTSQARPLLNVGDLDNANLFRLMQPLRGTMSTAESSPMVRQIAKQAAAQQFYVIKTEADAGGVRVTVSDATGSSFDTDERVAAFQADCERALGIRISVDFAPF